MDTSLELHLQTSEDSPTLNSLSVRGQSLTQLRRNRPKLKLQEETDQSKKYKERAQRNKQKMHGAGAKSKRKTQNVNQRIWSINRRDEQIQSLDCSPSLLIGVTPFCFADSRACTGGGPWQGLVPVATIPTLSSHPGNCAWPGLPRKESHTRKNYRLCLCLSGCHTKQRAREMQ